MNYGNRGNNHNPGNYDIGPDEERFPPNTEENESPLQPLEMITGFHENVDGGMEIEYERVYVHRPRGGIFFEPQDETPPDHIPSSQLNRYYLEKNRLSTFSNNWLPEYPVVPEDLARNGFIYIGPGDKVKCVFCLNILRGWEENDNVEVEHQRHYPDCPFVLGKVSHLNKALNAVEPSRMGLKMKDERLSHAEYRLNTFKTAPPHIAKRREEFAKAGFFYTGERDSLECFSCSLKLSNWEPNDDPVQEHYKFKSKCSYILKIIQARSITGSQVIPFNQAGFSVQASYNIAESSKAHKPVVKLFQSQQPADDQLQSKESLNKMLNNQKPHFQQLPTNFSQSKPEGLEALIEQDIKSNAVQAFRTVNDDLNVEEIRRLLEHIRINKGADYQLTYEDLEDNLDLTKKNW